MPKEPDINDMREKLRRQKKEKNQSLESRLLGSEKSEADEKDNQTELPEENSGEGSGKTSEQESPEALSDDSVIIENHYDYDKNTEAESNKTPVKEKQPFKMPKIKITPAKIITASAVVFIIILGVLIWYTASSASNVKQITFSGNHVITDEELSGRLQFEEGDKMFSINTTRAEENIALLPVIVDVTVEREWWNSVHVSVNEYNIIAYMENEGTFNPVMNNARVLRGYPVSPSNGPILYQFEGEEFENVIDEMENINPEILARISEIHYSPSENSNTRIHIFMNDGQEVVADYRDFGEKMNHYIGMKEEIGEDNTGIIDIEIGSSFLPYGSSEAEDVKRGIYEEPVQADYIDSINSSLVGVKDSLNQMGQDSESSSGNENEGENSNSSE